MKNIENTKMKINEGVIIADKVSTAAGEETVIDYSGKEDGRIVILLKSASGEKKVTILKGNALQGTKDMEIVIGSAKEVALAVESGKFVNGHGEMKGKLVMDGDAGVEVRVIELP